MHAEQVLFPNEVMTMKRMSRLAIAVMVMTTAVVVPGFGAHPAAAGPNPNAKLAMHLVASDDYLCCDDLAPASSADINVALSIADLAVTDYCGYILFLAYDIDLCIHCVEYYVTGWPMGRGAPALALPTYCEEALILGDPYEANGGEGSLACFVGTTCLGDPISHLAPFAYAFFDLSSYTGYFPIALDYSPSHYSYPYDPHNYVLGPGPDHVEDPVVEEKGCVIGSSGSDQTILLVAPNGGETLQVGSTPPIEWESTGFEIARIEYSADGGATWQDIATVSASARFYLWTVTDEQSTDCFVRVSDAVDGDPSDMSDASFTISYEYARVLRVPEEYPTIQYGIYAAAPADTVVVAPGEYFEGLAMKAGVALRSDAGSAQTIINGIGHDHAISFDRTLDSDGLVDGFTITGGNASGPGAEAQMGGGILLVGSGGTISNCVITGNQATIMGGGIALVAITEVTIVDCVISDNMAAEGGGIYFGGSDQITVLSTEIVDNTATGLGGGALCWISSPSISGCVFARNSAQDGGGLHCCYQASPSLNECTFTHNAASIGGGIACNVLCWPTLQNTLIVFSTQGEAAYCHDCSFPLLLCCDVYGNEGGDWVGCIEHQQGSNGNFSEDPLFCCASSGDYHLQPQSPCADHPICGLVGALGVGCTGPSRIEQATWSAIKAKFRQPAQD